MRLALYIGLVALLLAPCAQASAFHVGIADPGVGAIDTATVAELGISVERRTVDWQGESSFTGSLTWTPGVRAIVAVWNRVGVVPTTDIERSRYCGFVASVLDQYPQISDVVVWNEPNLAFFWGQGATAYAELVRDCSPVIRAHGARVLAPGMSPSTVEGVADVARHIAALGPHLIDGWDQHDYSEASLKEKIAAVRAAFGWQVPLLVGESGGSSGDDVAYLMGKAYCAGATDWLNFKLRDDGDWQPFGLIDSRGQHKNAWAAFRTTARLIESGAYDCSTPSPPPRWTPDELLAQRLGEIGAWTRDAYERL